MNWNDYEAIWKRQEPPVGAAADLAHLRATFETKHRKMAATLAVRDWAEAGAGLIVSVAFVAMIHGLWRQGKVFWPIGIGLGLVLGVTGFFLRERLRARRRRLGADATLREKLAADVAELRRQHFLLANAATWYLAPLFAAVLTVIATFYVNAQHWNPIREPWFVGGFIAFQALVFAGVWALNRHAVRTQIAPRLAELEKLQREFQP